MVTDFSSTNSVVNEFVAELRDAEVQQDPLRFRFNLKRLGSAMAFELSKSMRFNSEKVRTPLGTARMNRLAEQPVLATILRAGLPMHSGVAEVFDRAEQAFVSACRNYIDEDHSAFEIGIDAVSAPSLEGKVLVVSDPMLATGASLSQVLNRLFQSHGSPVAVHVLVAIASKQGINHVQRHHPRARLWVAAVDSELNKKGYIIPGLGDAGDLAYGTKI
ncbi:MAG TPA: uracil phosphoribosyltransferase [Flavobacteriales bacterium]|nr:uracil phosphoribosyltransferase [Flavobacteriales bacterium]|tara:strand:+ start:1175 stop:1828 length:654 start_codon:yes stop_codon:yes gene_type:complete